MKYLEEYIHSSKPVLVEFYATWSESCKRMDAALQEVKAKAGERIIFLRMDVEEFSDLIEQYTIYRIPTLILLKDGQIIWRKSGIIPAREILEQLSTVMA